MAEATPVEDAALAVRLPRSRRLRAGCAARNCASASQLRARTPAHAACARSHRGAAISQAASDACALQAFMAAVQQAGTTPSVEADDNGSVFSEAPSMSEARSVVSEVPSMASYATSMSNATAAFGGAQPAAAYTPAGAFAEPVRSTATFKPPQEQPQQFKPAPPLDQFQIPVTTYQPSTAPSAAGSYAPSYAPSYAQSYAPSVVDTEVRPSCHAAAAARAAGGASRRTPAVAPEPQNSLHCQLAAASPARLAADATRPPRHARRMHAARWTHSTNTCARRTLRLRRRRCARRRRRVRRSAATARRRRAPARPPAPWPALSRAQWRTRRWVR